MDTGRPIASWSKAKSPQALSEVEANHGKYTASSAFATTCHLAKPRRQVWIGLGWLGQKVLHLIELERSTEAEVGPHAHYEIVLGELEGDGKLQSLAIVVARRQRLCGTAPEAADTSMKV